MPLATEPSKLFEIVLESDKDKPQDQQPRFIYRYLTGRQWLEVADVQDRLEELKSAKEVAQKTYEAARTGLVGWVNITDSQSGPVPFDPEKLEDVIGIVEVQELIQKLLKQHPALSAKKKLDSPSDCSSDDASSPAESVPDTASAKKD